jgi:hypothetical protein
MAAAIGIELLTEERYRELQTPADIRKLGGALFCDRRYETVFVYHNAARGFRGSLRA